MPPPWRNQRPATGVDTPISSAASSVRLPCAISRQKARSTCRAGIGRPGERIAGRRAIRLLLTPCHRTPPRSGEVLRRPVESALAAAVAVEDHTLGGPAGDQGGREGLDD